MKYYDQANSFYEIWDPKTGFYIRSGIVEKNELTGKMVDTGVDPFMRSYPSHLDVAIVGSCKNSELGLCRAGGIDCYQSGNAIKQPDMLLSDFTRLCEESNGRLLQIALGGRGDPNHHKNFVSILQTARKHNIVPNYTTSGIQLTDEQIWATKEFCGAVAISWQRGEHTLEAIERFTKAGVKTNIQYVLGNHTIDEAIDIVEGTQPIPNVNAILFLLYKPVGKGLICRVLTLEQDKEKLERFITAVANQSSGLKLGFDTCSLPMLLQFPIFAEKISMASSEPCEGSRFSCYVTPDMVALPCSFDQERVWGVDLKKSTIAKAWKSPQFESFRNRMRNACPSCSSKNNCYGGCPVKPSIVLCNKTERNTNV